MGDVDKSWRSIRDFSLPEYLAYLRRLERADERTRTAYPCSLRVIGRALQGCAGGCKFRISKGVSLLRVAACCTVLRSRWCQSGVRSTWITCRRLLYKPDARIRYFRRAMSEFGLGRATLYRASSLLAAPATCTTVTASIFINVEQRGFELLTSAVQSQIHNALVVHWCSESAANKHILSSRLS
jgi:hypothetical protein